MATREEARNLIRRRLGDLNAPLSFSDLQINQWLNDAIADYSVHFPRQLAADLAATTGQHEYSLASLVNPQALLRVEYPTGDDPPTYLIRSDEATPRFYGGDYYDIQGERPQALIVGPDATTGETIRVDYLADHAYANEDEDVLTVPDSHLEALILFARVAALQALENREEQSPDPTTILVTMMSQAVQRATQQYHTKLRELKALRFTTSAVVQWTFE